MELLLLYFNSNICRLLELLTEIETKTKKHIEDKTTDFHAAYTALDRKLRELEQEVNFYFMLLYINCISEIEYCS